MFGYFLFRGYVISLEFFCITFKIRYFKCISMPFLLFNAILVNISVKIFRVRTRIILSTECSIFFILFCNKLKKTSEYFDGVFR